MEIAGCPGSLYITAKKRIASKKKLRFDQHFYYSLSGGFSSRDNEAEKAYKIGKKGLFCEAFGSAEKAGKGSPGKEKSALCAKAKRKSLSPGAKEMKKARHFAPPFLPLNAQPGARDRAPR